MPTDTKTPAPTTRLVTSPIAAPVDVVVLLGPDRHGSCTELFDAISEIKQRDHAAVLVVFTHPVDADILDRAGVAGADLCVVAPSPADLFGHIERTRARYRAATEPTSRRPPADRYAREDPLDTFWRRTHCLRRS